jgi:hypothetical protein
MLHAFRRLTCLNVIFLPMLLLVVACSSTVTSTVTSTSGASSSTASTTSTMATATSAPPTATATPAPQAQVNFAFHEITVPAGTPIQDSVSCPTGTELLGGGYVINTSQNYLVTANDSYPTSATTWTIDTAQGASIPLDVHVEAECLQANFTVQSQIASQANTADGGSVVATCPSGSIVSGGGYHAANGVTITSEPSGNGWKYGNAGPPGGSNYTFTAYAICVSGAPLAADTIKQTALVVPSDNGGTNVVTKGTYLNCPANDLATGGGFDGSAVVDFEGFYIFGSNSGTNGPLQHPQGWGIFAENVSYSSQAAQVFAVCLKY